MIWKISEYSIPEIQMQYCTLGTVVSGRWNILSESPEDTVFLCTAPGDRPAGSPVAGDDAPGDDARGRNARDADAGDDAGNDADAGNAGDADAGDVGRWLSGLHAAPCVGGPSGQGQAHADAAAELECAEKETRHWIHKWCVEQNGGKLAEIPPILQNTKLTPTVPNVMMMAAQKHAANKCMGVRDIEECMVEGTKTFWKKSAAYRWRNYGAVYNDMQCAARGLYKLPGIGEKRMQKRQVVAALLAETSQEWMIAAQAALGCGLTLTTVYATLGHDAMLHGLRQTEAEIIFVDWGLFETLKDEVLAKCPALRYIVFIGKDLVPRKTTGGQHAPFPSPQEVATFPPVASKARCTTLDTLIHTGDAAKNQVNLNAVAPNPEDVAMM